MDKKSILVFGVGELQKSIIERAQAKGLYVVGIDPCEDAACKNIVDAFEVIDGQDFKRTLAVAKKYQISGIVTAATDKPLVMMARIANELGLQFFSEETAIISTDKYKMKGCFQKANIPCAKGELYRDLIKEDVERFEYPVIVKPIDNSGSRGVIFCQSEQNLLNSFQEVRQYTKSDYVLIEEYIAGKEFSVEALHYDGKNEIIQITEKLTSEFPYNVELGHKQPADISQDCRFQIEEVIEKISKNLYFKNCASHTEIKINNRGVFVIETSPRLGGDYITSHLTPLSIGINMEDLLIDISLNNKIVIPQKIDKYSAVRFFNLTPNTIIKNSASVYRYLESIDCECFSFKLNDNDVVPIIENSLDRYGEVVVSADNEIELEDKLLKMNIEI